MNTTTNTETVCEILLNQINGTDRWARARWGVMQILDTGDGLQFNCTKRIKIMVKLVADLYTVEIGRMKGRFDYVQKAEVEGVYADQLVAVINSEFSKAFGTL